MSDWTKEEYKKLNGYRKAKHLVVGATVTIETRTFPITILPNSIDWRNAGAVTSSLN
jgi:hypothetical protein